MIKKLDYFVGVIAIFAFILLIIDTSGYFSQYKEIIRIINFFILAVFILDVIARYVFSRNKLFYFKQNWVDFIVFIPLFTFIRSLANSSFSVVFWQLVIIVMLLSRLRKANKFIALLSLKPAQVMAVSFLFAIASGTIMLMLPIATKTGVKTSFIDALFTATSATCVTGLIVKDTANYFSIFGQTVILFLIQIGGLGIMTFSVSLALLLKKKIDIQQRILMKDILDQNTLEGIKSLIIFIIKMTLFCELIGFIALFISWRDKFDNFWLSAYHAFFHSISAFCNAGFSTFSDSLMGFAENIPTNLTISLLIILGGVGFIVIKDLYDYIKRILTRNFSHPIRLKVQTKLVLLISFILIISGALGLYFLERNYSFAHFSAKGKILLAIFQSITARTAGFNTCDISNLTSASLLLIAFLMFIGGSPGSTAGGIKTTTLGILWALFVSGIKQREQVEIYGRTIPYQVVRKAISVFIASCIVLFVFSLSLLYIEQKPFDKIIFETTSAFGTVGLSAGITAQLSSAGKLLITLLMFIGRLGPLTIGYMFTKTTRSVNYLYAEERPMVG